MHFWVNVLSSEIIYWACVRLILTSLTFHIAHLYRYTQNISGLPQKLIWCKQFGVHLLLRFASVYSVHQS